MFRYAHNEYFYLLFILPVMVILYFLIYKKQQKALLNFASIKMQKVIIPLKSSLKAHLKFGIVLAAIFLLIFSLANLQTGTRIEEVKQVGIDVFILLDVSLSMKAEDIKPNRLEKAKYDIGKLIQRLRGDRIGLIVFSGEAYVQFPLTTDYAAANLFLNAVDVSSVPQPGTNVAAAIELAKKSFKTESETQKAIIVITDGEDHEGNVEAVAEDALNSGIGVFAIGMGSPSGAPIPIYNESGIQTGYKKDNSGQPVLTKLDETTLQNLTAKGGGTYYHAGNNEDALDKIYNDLSAIEETEFGATKITEYEDRFYFTLALALILLVAEFLIPLNKSKLITRLMGYNYNEK